MTELTDGTNLFGLEPFPPKSGRAIALRAVGLTKTYPAVAGALRGDVELFRGLDLIVHSGEMVAVVGESGAGKSSLLHLLAALDRPSAGEVWYGEDRLSGMSARQASEFRNRRGGGTYGSFITCCRSFRPWRMLPCRYSHAGTGRKTSLDKARIWLERVGLGGREEHRSGELSGGEQQAGQPGTGIGQRAGGAAGGRTDRRSGRKNGRRGLWTDTEVAHRSRADQRVSDA